MADEREYFERLSEILQEHGFDWVLTQVQAEISEGRVVSKEVSAPSIESAVDPVTMVRQTPRRRRASLVTTLPLSPRERLEVLIRGIEAAVVTRAELEEAVFRMTKNVSQIDFKPDESDKDFFTDDRHAHSLRIERVSSADRVKEDLSKTLKELRIILDAST